MRAGRLEELAMHPTVKPVALVADAIKDCSRRGGLVLDPFCGSGTILIAAERTGRKARALEIDPATSTSQCGAGRPTPARLPSLLGQAKPLRQPNAGAPPSRPPPDHGEQICQNTTTTAAPILPLRDPRRPTKSTRSVRVVRPRNIGSSLDRVAIQRAPNASRRRWHRISRLALERALNKTVKLKQGDKERTVTMAVAGIEQLVAQYAKGDRHARRDLIALADKLGVDLMAGQRQAIQEALATNHEAILSTYVQRQYDKVSPPRRCSLLPSSWTMTQKIRTRTDRHAPIPKMPAA